MERHRDMLICEIRRGADGDEYELAISAPGRGLRVERFDSPTSLLERWLQCQQSLRATGWRPRD